jgi:hypothetical protein
MDYFHACTITNTMPLIENGGYEAYNEAKNAGNNRFRKLF